MVSIWIMQQPISFPLLKLPSSFGPRFGNLNARKLDLSSSSIVLKAAAISNNDTAAANDDDANVKVVEQAKATTNDNEANAVISKSPVDKFQQMIGSVSPIVMRIPDRSNIFVGLCITAAVSVISMIFYMRKKSMYSYPGSVADLVRRGQLRSDRRGISRPLKYEDPFNNPLVKAGKGKSTIEMCGKVYRLAPVNLTEEQRTVHQKRRSRAYQWKRPTVFLKEGDAVPPDVDPDTIRWIPANHPFATTASDIDEDLAQNNVYQKRGVPFRIQAEHDALQRKLEALQNDEKLNNLVIDPRYAKDFERPFKSPSKPRESADLCLSDNQVDNSSSAKLDDVADSSDSNSPSEGVQKQPPII